MKTCLVNIAQTADGFNLGFDECAKGIIETSRKVKRSFQTVMGKLRDYKGLAFNDALSKVEADFRAAE